MLTDDGPDLLAMLTGCDVAPPPPQQQPQPRSLSGIPIASAAPARRDREPDYAPAMMSSLSQTGTSASFGRPPFAAGPPSPPSTTFVCKQPPQQQQQRPIFPALAARSPSLSVPLGTTTTSPAAATPPSPTVMHLSRSVSAVAASKISIVDDKFVLASPSTPLASAATAKSSSSSLLARSASASAPAPYLAARAAPSAAGAAAAAAHASGAAVLRSKLVARFHAELAPIWPSSTTATSATTTASATTAPPPPPAKHAPSSALAELCDGIVDAILAKCSSAPRESSECAAQLLGLLTDAVNGPPLRQRLGRGTLSVAAFATAKLSDLLSDEQKRADAKDLAEHLLSRDQKYMLKLQAAPSPFFKCRKCGSRECAVQQKQTSRGDEGSTCFIICCDCRHAWKTRQ